MKNIFVFLFLILTASAATPDGNAIVNAYQQAHARKDLEGLMALVEFSPQTPKEIHDQKKASFLTQLTLVVLGVEVAPLDEDDVRTLARLQEFYATTLEPKAKLVVLFDKSKQEGRVKNGRVVSFLGIKDGAYRILTAKTKEPDPVTKPAAPKDHGSS